jgi:AcrR family transcriptional regulator
MGNVATEKMSRRARQAAETRADILAAARRLFAERGYVATTLADIAGEADVAVQTIFSSVGSKTDVVMALFEQIGPQAGRDASDVFRIVSSAEDAETVLATGIGYMRRLQEEWRDVIVAVHTAAAGDAEAAEALREGRQRHRQGTRAMAERLAAIGCLRAGLPVDEAADVISMLTSHESFVQLTGQYGWSYDRCERWLAEAISRLLLAN